MQAGKLRKRVTIQEQDVSRDDFGAEVVTWVDVATVWAAVEPLRGREFLEAQREGATVDTRIRIRGCLTVTPAMQAVWGSHTYDIQAVIRVEERGVETQLMCRELL